MKRLLFIVAVAAGMLSCRSVRNEGYVQQHHYSVGADTLSLVVNAERRDSSRYFHGVIDSLSRELLKVRKEYRSLYERDSVNEVTDRKDSVSVKDTTWMNINADGSVTYHNYREKNTYSYQQVERYKQQVRKESQATIDSLIAQNSILQATIDSLSSVHIEADSIAQYEAKTDSVSDTSIQSESKTIYKNSLWDKLGASAVTVIILIFIVVLFYVYFRFFGSE